jgi:hypothetical protein
MMVPWSPATPPSFPPGVDHGTIIKAGTRVIDAFQEADRYPLKRRDLGAARKARPLPLRTGA